METSEHILLAHGGGGTLTKELIEKYIISRLGNDVLNPLLDSAILPRPEGRLCMTTDSFVVQPLTFPGGDIGRLAVCGTVNDIAVMGARPLALSLGLIIEEGLSLDLLASIIDSIASTAKEAGVDIVTGDTKVIERRQGDGLLINTTGIGVLPDDFTIDPKRLAPDDVIIVNGGIAEHGLAVMSAREGLAFDTDLRSDVAPLNGLIADLMATNADIKFMRDPTRAGIAGVLADLTEATGLTIEIEEADIPLTTTARHTAEMLGLDPLTVANEGKVVVVVPEADADAILSACQNHALGKTAAVIGQITSATPPLIELISRAGGRRIVQRPYGEELPRIC